VLWAYPNSLRALLRQTGSLAAVVRPRLLVTTAEPLDDVLRRQLTADGDLEIRNFYGSVECGRIAWECAAGEGLHVNTDCLILELDDDVEVPGAGRSVVITNLNTAAIPIIRYRLGDLVERVDGRCSCGAPLPLIQPPVGRVWDAVELPSGRLLSPWGFKTFLRGVEDLRQFRVVQPAVDRLVFELRFAAPPAPAALDTLREQVARHLGEPMRIDVERVEAFEEGPGKFRNFVSHVGGRG
jgi:phenylacetate-CoA ligase